MEYEHKISRSSHDSELQKDSKRTEESPLDKLSPGKRHKLFSKVEDQNRSNSLPGDNSQKHGDTNQQNKVAKEQKEYKEKSGTTDQSLPQTSVERVSQAETSRREGFVSNMDRAGIAEGESSGSSWETVKSLLEKNIVKRAKETVGWAWQTLSEKSLRQCAKETVEWTWQNGVKSFSAKKFMRYLVMYLAVSRPLIADAVKIYGKNGCSIDSQLVFDEHPSEYNNARRIVEARFERKFAKLSDRYAKNPCDEKYKEIRVTFDRDLKLEGEDVGGVVYPSDELAHIFLRPTASELTFGHIGSRALHEFSHVVQDFILPSPEDYPNSAVSWVHEALADYNSYIYGTEQDTKHWPVPPNLESFPHYGYTRIVGGFMLWLDKQFPGFVDNINRIAQKKQIHWKDIENLTRKPLMDLWEEYKKINFTAEMSQFIEEQREKYLGSGQQRKGKEKKDEL